MVAVNVNWRVLHSDNNQNTIGKQTLAQYFYYNGESLSSGIPQILFMLPANFLSACTGCSWVNLWK